MALSLRTGLIRKKKRSIYYILCTKNYGEKPISGVSASPVLMAYSCLSWMQINVIEKSNQIPAPI